MHFTYGQGGPDEFERLVGCTLVPLHASPAFKELLRPKG